MWGEVKVNSRILLQELANQGGFVSRQIVQDDMNLLIAGAEGDDFLEEGDELAAGMTSSGFAMDPTCGGIQGGIQGESSVTEILEAAARPGESGRTGSSRSSA